MNWNRLKGLVIARRPNGPTWQSVMLDEGADSHVASLLGMASLYFMRDRISGLEIFLLFLKKLLNIVLVNKLSAVFI